MGLSIRVKYKYGLDALGMRSTHDDGGTKVRVVSVACVRKGVLGRKEKGLGLLRKLTGAQVRHGLR